MGQSLAHVTPYFNRLSRVTYITSFFGLKGESKVTKNSNFVETISNCQLEWSKVRGVLYVHNRDTGMTVVRISNMKIPTDLSVSLNDNMLDLTVGVTKGRYEMKGKNEPSRSSSDRIKSESTSTSDSIAKQSATPNRLRKTRRSSGRNS